MQGDSMILQVKCPCCNGEGGEHDIITDDGQGPYYECGFCNGNGTVAIWQRLVWLWDCQIMDWVRRRLP